MKIALSKSVWKLWMLVTNAMTTGKIEDHVIPVKRCVSWFNREVRTNRTVRNQCFKRFKLLQTQDVDPSEVTEAWKSTRGHTINVSL